MTFSAHANQIPLAVVAIVPQTFRLCFVTQFGVIVENNRGSHFRGWEGVIRVAGFAWLALECAERVSIPRCARAPHFRASKIPFYSSLFCFFAGIMIVLGEILTGCFSEEIAVPSASRLSPIDFEKDFNEIQ